MAWEGVFAPGDWRARLAKRQRDVIEYYRGLLRQPMPDEERKAILDRVARLKNEIDALEAA
jgi:hypothetical protein